MPYSVYRSCNLQGAEALPPGRLWDVAPIDQVRKLLDRIFLVGGIPVCLWLVVIVGALTLDDSGLIR